MACSKPRHITTLLVCILLSAGAACSESDEPASPAPASAPSDQRDSSRADLELLAPATETQPAADPSAQAERREERHRMVQRQIAARGVKDERVLDAMRKVPRHWFVPAESAPLAYADTALPIGHGQTISQPYIVGLMTELLDLAGDEKVLEIGTGSGYQAAVLAELAKEVYSIEIVEPLGKRAAASLARHGFRNVRVRIGDGYKGWPEHAKFDAIIVTCAPESPPGPLIDQLAPGGVMCIPVGPQDGIQRLVKLHKRPDGRLEKQHVEWVRFVPMTGSAGKDR